MNGEQRVHSGRSAIRMLQRIEQLDEQRLVARASVHRGTFEVLESMAQAAAYHARYLEDCGRHAFVAELCALRLAPPSAFGETLSVAVEAEQKARSSAAYRYQCRVVLQEHLIAEVQVLVGMRAYDDRFSREALASHHRQVLQCLRNA